MKLSETSERETLSLMTLEYEVESDGHFIEEPVVQLFCRDSQGNRRTVEVENFYPFFYVHEDEIAHYEDDLFSESMIREIEVQHGVVSDDNVHNDSLKEMGEPPRKTLSGEPLARIYAVKPKPHIPNLRSFFDETWEADVFFTNRFLIESGITRGLSVPRGAERVEFSEIEAVDAPDSVKPRMVCVDIEVWTGGVFPSPEEARQPVTAVTAYDTYDDEYIVYALHPDGTKVDADHNWPSYEVLSETDDISEAFSGLLPDGVEANNVSFEIFKRESYLLGSLNKWIVDKDPDLLTGWNSSANDKGSGFDYPYIINRCQKIGEGTYEDLSPTDTCFVSGRGAPVVGGREMFDMLQAYKKTQIHEKDSYRLNAIAEDELGYGKEDLESTDDGWLFEPEEFLRYNIRDVQAVIEIEEAKGVIDMYDHIRTITGTSYSECADSNIGIIDMLYLRRAKSRGLALPTSTKPQRGWYYGAEVFNTVPGKHENVVYPDLASLYPYLMWSLNVSPETMFESLEEARAAGYEEDDLYKAYIDYRDDSEKRNSDPDTEAIYYTKPEVKEGFVRSVITELTDMKYEYKKDEYPDEAYEAVKRIVNSVYGVFGDSSSYGKGFRMFDWRLAETITISGRMVLEYTADEFTEFLQEHGYRSAKLIGGDTDSCMTTIPDATSQQDALDAAFTAANHVNDSYDEFMEREFWIDDPDMHKMEVEVESYAEALFFQSDFKHGNRDEGVKKRYAQLVTWDEGEYIEDPDVKTKGFELVRSDSSQLTKRVQERVLEMILREDDPKDSVTEYVCDEWNAFIEGDVDLADIGKPSAIKNDLWDYGWSEKEVDEGERVVSVDGETLSTGDEYVKFYTPQPHIRGARYASEYVENENPREGSKPLSFYLDGIKPNNDGLPETYDYDHCSLNADEDLPCDNEREMHEIDRTVDAIALEDTRNMPEVARVDWEKMAEKNIRGPVEPIVWTMGWEFDDIITEGEQTGLSEFM